MRERKKSKRRLNGPYPFRQRFGQNVWEWISANLGHWVFKKKEIMKIELADVTNTLLREILEPRIRRKDIAQTYGLAIKSSEPVDWPTVNAAIMKRWSRSGLIWIKTQAWSGKCFQK